MHVHEETAGILRLKSAITAGRVLVAGWRLQYALKRNSHWHLQPRVPAGNPDGGQWSGSGSLAGNHETLLAQAESGGSFSVDLLEEEAAGGHTIRAHVGESSESLLARVRGEGISVGPFVRIGIYRVGSFPSVAAANKLVNATLSRQHVIVEQVAKGDRPYAFIKANFGSKTGVEAIRRRYYSQPYLRDTYGVGVYILRAPDRRKGFRVITAYPRND